MIRCRDPSTHCASTGSKNSTSMNGVVGIMSVGPFLMFTPAAARAHSETDLVQLDREVPVIVRFNGAKRDFRQLNAIGLGEAKHISKLSAIEIPCTA